MTAFTVNFLSRRRVIQVFAFGARILDGAFMTQELSFKSSNSESGESTTVSSVSIADPFVLLRMSDGSIQLLVGGMFLLVLFFFCCSLIGWTLFLLVFF